MAKVRRKRETSRLKGLEAKGWKHWVKAIVPRKARRTEPRGDSQVGFMCTNIRSAIPARQCGIYEWRAKGKSARQPNYIVYVGSTCRGKPGALRRRIIEYCTDGSHKKDLMNEALRKGYELWVRVKTSRGTDNAQELENELLKKYDYAWNVRNNGKIRHILPSAKKSSS